LFKSLGKECLLKENVLEIDHFLRKTLRKFVISEEI